MKYLMHVYSNAKPGRDAEYMEWYEKQHLGEICAIPGVRSGRMFEVVPGSPAQPGTTYLALYELETDDPTKILQEMARRGQAGEMSRTDAVDTTSARITFYKQKF